MNLQTILEKQINKQKKEDERLAKNYEDFCSDLEEQRLEAIKNQEEFNKFFKTILN